MLHELLKPEKTMNHSRLLIVGLGNSLLQDDGVGVHAVRLIQHNPPPGALAVEVGCAVFNALHLLEEADHVLALDAMQAGGAPGTVYRFGPEDVLPAGETTSMHELGLIAALNLLPENRRPVVDVLGVEPQEMDYGLELTPPVKAALPTLIRAAEEWALSAYLSAEKEY